MGPPKKAEKGCQANCPERNKKAIVNMCTAEMPNATPHNIETTPVS